MRTDSTWRADGREQIEVDMIVFHIALRDHKIVLLLPKFGDDLAMDHGKVGIASDSATRKQWRRLQPAVVRRHEAQHSVQPCEEKAANPV